MALGLGLGDEISGAVGDKHTIVSVTNNAGTAVYNTQLPHGLSVSDLIALHLSQASYNGFDGPTVTAVGSTKSFSNGAPYNGDAIGYWS